MLNHTEMHSDNKMRKRGHEGGLGGGSEVERKKKEQGKWKGGKNEPEKLLVGRGQEGVKKTKRQNQETQLCSSFGGDASYK